MTATASRVPDAAPRTTRFPPALLVFLAGVLVYANALRGEFVFDDWSLVVENERIRSAAAAPSILFSNLWASLGRVTPYYRPVPLLLLVPVHAAFGLNPVAFHAVNVVLHSASAAIVFLIVRRLLRSSPGASERSSSWPAVVAGLLFAVHPANSEAVAWISGIIDVSFAFFSVLTLYLHVLATRSSRFGVRVLSAVALLLALLSKEPALALPIVLVAHDVAIGRGVRFAPRDIVARWGPAAVACGVYVALRLGALGDFMPESPGTRSIGDAAAQVPVLLSRCLRTLVFPVDLSVAHTVPPVGSLLAPESLVALVLLSAAAVLATFLARTGPTALVGVLLTVLPLVPTVAGLALHPPELSFAYSFADRHLYLSTVGLSLVAASVLDRVQRDRGAWFKPAVATSVAVLVAMAASTALRTAVWHDDVTLWSDAVRKSPEHPGARFNLGVSLVSRGDVAGGARELQTAARLDPERVKHQLAAGMDAARRGMTRRAINQLHALTLMRPDFAEGHYQLAVALESAGRRDEAMQEYVTSLEADPLHAAALDRVVALLVEGGRVRDARRLVDQLLESHPHHEPARRARDMLGADAPPRTRGSAGAP